VLVGYTRASKEGKIVIKLLKAGSNRFGYVVAEVDSPEHVKLKTTSNTMATPIKESGEQ